MTPREGDLSGEGVILLTVRFHGTDLEIVARNG